MWKDFWNYELITLGGGQSLRVSQVVLALVVLVAGLILSRLLAKFLGRRLIRRKVSATAAQAFEKLTFYILLATVVLTTLHLLQIPITMFAFLGGAVAIGVGFGTRNLINNFISGWILIGERPFGIDDLVEIDGNLGRVRAIGGRSTQIRRNDGVDIMVPNSLLAERTLVNWTHADQLVRLKVRVGVAYGSPTDEVRDILLSIAEDHENAIKDPPPMVIFEEFGDNSLNFDLFVWAEVSQVKELRLTRSELRFEIDRRFREAGIVIAFPQRDVHLDTDKPIRIEMTGGAANT